MINLYACLLTIILELLVILIFNHKNKLFPLMSISIFMNIITNITLNYLLGIFSERIIVYWILLIILEIIIVLVEAKGYYLLLKDYKKSFSMSIICNIFSFVLGTFILNLLMFYGII